jgi:hypothetical protein
MPSERSDATAFDWRLYADATCAGLTALIPLPIVDLIFEYYFRYRMPGAIARARGRDVEQAVLQRLGRRRFGGGLLGGCLMVPVMVGKYVVKKLWRKIIYIFAIADAGSQVSEYWHRAYLVDHMMRAGHLGRNADVDRAIRTFEQVLRDTDTSPVRGLANQIVAATGRALRLLVRARRRGTAEETESLGKILGSQWDSVEGSFHAAALEYNRVYVEGPEGSAKTPTA